MVDKSVVIFANTLSSLRIDPNTGNQSLHLERDSFLIIELEPRIKLYLKPSCLQQPSYIGLNPFSPLFGFKLARVGFLSLEFQNILIYPERKFPIQDSWG